MVGGSESQVAKLSYVSDDLPWLDTMEELMDSVESKPMCLPREHQPIKSIQEAYKDELKMKPAAENIHLSLCGGMGADVYGMRQMGAKLTKTILVEKDKMKHIMYDNLNPPDEMPDGGIDYLWHTDVHDITHENIEMLGAGSIGRLDISAPCKDFVLSRLLPSKYGGKLKNLRPS